MTEQGRKGELRSRKGKEPGKQNKEEWEERATCHAGTSVRTSGHQATLSEHRGQVKARHTSITETNRLPSALVEVPSLSKLKNKGRDNREQLVTVKKLKSRMLLATKKAKVQFKIKLKKKQVQQQSRF